MLKINKTEEPSFHTDFKKRGNPKNWNDYDHAIKAELKEHMLTKEQESCCPYCERKIRSINDSHIEHIEPKDRSSNFKDYYNMLTSCNGITTCGNFKLNKFSEKFINPISEEPSKFLIHSIESGKVMPLESLDDLGRSRAIYTVDTLNLNDKQLVSERNKLNKELISIRLNNEEVFRDYLAYYLKDSQSFKSLIELHLDYCQ